MQSKCMKTDQPLVCVFFLSLPWLSVHCLASCCLFKSALFYGVALYFSQLKRKTVFHQTWCSGSDFLKRTAPDLLSWLHHLSINRLTHFLSRQPSLQTSGTKVYMTHDFYLGPVMYNIVATRPFFFVLGNLSHNASLVFMLISDKVYTQLFPLALSPFFSLSFLFERNRY